MPETSYSVPVSVDPAGLSSLVLSLLQDTDNTLSFIFLLDGQILRSSLQEWLHEEGRSLPEQALSLEYIRETAGPSPEASLAHDDWVSCVRATADSDVVSGCYDGTLHVWRPDGQHVLTVSAHSEPVKCVDVVGARLDDSLLVVSGSMDQTLLLWRYRDDAQMQCVATMKGHSKSVDCVSAWSRELVASGSWDTDIHIWRPSISSSDLVPDTSVKRSGQKRPRKAPQLEPSCSLTDHHEAVSSLDWLSATELVSGSWDHTVRVWDLETASVSWRLAGHKALFSVAASQAGLLSSSADRHVRLSDTRCEGVQAQFSSHVGWVTSVCWDNTATVPTQFISCGHDALLKQWDVRCSRAPLYDLHGHTDRATDCHWGGENGALTVSASVDNTVKVFSHDRCSREQ